MNTATKYCLAAVSICVSIAYWSSCAFIQAAYADDDKWEMSDEDRAWYDSSSRVHMFQLFIKRMNWPEAADTLSEAYLEMCGGTPNALGSVVVRDLGSQPVKVSQPEDIEATADKATVETSIELQDGSQVQMRYALEQFEPGPHGWSITQIVVKHRGDQWVMCGEVPSFASQVEAGPDGE